MARESFLNQFRAAILEERLVAMVLSRPAKGGAESERQTVRPLQIRGQRMLQWTRRAGTQDLHENLSPETSETRLRELVPAVYRNVHLHCTDLEVELRASRKGELRCTSRKMARPAPDTSHNRQKERLIPEGLPCPFLEAIGVMTSGGAVRAQQQHKFRQINRYLEFIQDIRPALPREGRLEVVDFGCGKSGLTFALHHLLQQIWERDVHVVGLDWNPSVVETCRGIAVRLGLEGIEFQAGDIASYEPSGPVHLAVSLHACDTATDFALAKAVQWEVAVALAVPCCQHELAPQLTSSGLEELLRHGLLRERLAADATDALRASLMEVAGYRTQVVQFIELEHTPKNLLLRCVRKGGKPEEADGARLSSYLACRDALGVQRFTLERLLVDKLEAGIKQPSPASAGDGQPD